MEPEGPCAPKLLAQHLTSAQPVEGGFRFGSLPVFDRVWVQGTVTQKLAGALKLDDGTGTVDVVVGSVGAAPGLEIDNVQINSYVLVVGKLLARQQGSHLQLHVKAHKLLNLSCDPSAASQRMMHWNLEVAELHRLLEAAAAAGAAT